MIHPTAIIETGATLGNNCSIGPYCIVGKDVVLGDNVTLVSHAVVVGLTTVGEGTIIYPFASIGHVTQDLKYAGEPSKLIIGKNNKIREYVTMQPGTANGGMITQVGDNNLFMIGVHVAHDCIVGNNVVISNQSALAGHVIVEDRVIIGGLAGIRQFVRIGENAMISGMTGVANDVIPFGLVFGHRGKLYGLNIVGMRRRHMSRDDIHQLRRAYKYLFSKSGSLAERIRDLANQPDPSEALQKVIRFLQAKSLQGICLPKNDTGEVEDNLDNAF